MCARFGRVLAASGIAALNISDMNRDYMLT